MLPKIVKDSKSGQKVELINLLAEFKTWRCVCHKWGEVRKDPFFFFFLNSAVVLLLKLYLWQNNLLPVLCIVPCNGWWELKHW